MRQAIATVRVGDGRVKGFISINDSSTWPGGTLVRGSSDYMKQLESLANKEAQLASKREFFNQSLALQQQNITEQLYQDILEQTAVVAKAKGLDLVLEKSDPEIPAPNGTQLELAMGTHKVLFAGGCIDITTEVTAGIDAKGAKK